MAVLARRLEISCYNGFVMKKSVIFAAILCLIISLVHSEKIKKPVKFPLSASAMIMRAGLFPRPRDRADIQLAGIVEPDKELAARYAKNFKLDANLFYSSLADLLAKASVQAVATFTSTFDHRRVGEECAAHGITVMMEKPLAARLWEFGRMLSLRDEPGSKPKLY
jgi:hypothetical protein